MRSTNSREFSVINCEIQALRSEIEDTNLMLEKKRKLLSKQEREIHEKARMISFFENKIMSPSFKPKKRSFKKIRTKK